MSRNTNKIARRGTIAWWKLIWEEMPPIPMSDSTVVYRSHPSFVELSANETEPYTDGDQICCTVAAVPTTRHEKHYTTKKASYSWVSENAQAWIASEARYLADDVIIVRHRYAGWVEIGRHKVIAFERGSNGEWERLANLNSKRVRELLDQYDAYLRLRGT